jgi:hypothetical protein
LQCGDNHRPNHKARTYEQRTRTPTDKAGHYRKKGCTAFAAAVSLPNFSARLLEASPPSQDSQQHERKDKAASF